MREIKIIGKKELKELRNQCIRELIHLDTIITVTVRLVLEKVARISGQNSLRYYRIDTNQ